jgi:acyl-CoA synthetase (AMP-forming)/AMP-acid ligase II/enoyl-CoA hydratase/carnithine racemase
MNETMKTTGPILPVRTIGDIEAIEALPYDQRVSARNLHDLLLATARNCGERPALTVLNAPDPDAIGVTLTHRQLLEEVTRAANLFHRLGLSPEKGVVAFLAPTLPQLPVLLLGAQIAGTAGSINYLLSGEAIIDLLNAQQATILVLASKQADEACWQKGQDLRSAVPSLEHILVIGPGAEDIGLAAEPGDRLLFNPSADRNTVCALFHTGGTTGRPKLVRLTHGNQIHAAFGFGQVFGYDHQDVVINGFPFFHVGGTMTVGLAVLAAGGHMIVPSPYALRPKAVIDNYWALVDHFRVTVVNGVPTSIAALTASFEPGLDVTSVRMAATGGAVCPKAVGQAFMDRTGIGLFETYGMTETAAAIAFNPARGNPLAGSAGFRAPYSQTRIIGLEGSDTHPLGPNEPGLVQVRGPQVFPGYLDPAHNIGVLSADGWLTTGDVGYLTEDQRLVLTGREKDLIVRSGHNIDPAAIEDVANQFEGVAISAAVGMPDQYAGEVPALFVVPQAGAAIDVDRLRRHLDEHIHEPPARPRLIEIIEALPVTAVGKIYKPALRDMAITQKVRLECRKACGAAASATVEIGLDDHKRPLVRVRTTGAGGAGLAALRNALAPLPQTYLVTAADHGDAVLLAFENGIATLTLNRPEALNAMSRSLVGTLAQHIDAIERLDGLRAVIITGNGRAFSAGGDLVEFEQALNDGSDLLLADLRYNQSVLSRIEALAVPVIGAANGVAVAGGLELLLCCDIVLAARGARMGDGHSRYGIVPAGGASVRLPERVSPSQAAELFYTASLVEAERLQSWGLVNEVVPPEQLLDRARAVASDIAARSPEVNRHTKAMLREGRDPEERARRLDAELVHFAEHVHGRDLATGLSAFNNKRPPVFS